MQSDNPLIPAPREMPSIKAILDSLNTALAKHNLNADQYLKVISNVMASLLADRSEIYDSQWRVDFDKLVAQYRMKTVLKKTVGQA